MEREFLSSLAAQVPNQVEVGIGDDAAVVQWPADTRVVICTDMVCDGTDFHLLQCGAEAAGRKALAVNLSDLAAMAAKPVAAVCSMHLPRETAAETARGVTRGVLTLAEEFGVALVGGDTGVWDHPLAINVTVLGEKTAADSKTWLRSGARSGDRILVTGSLGGSIAGKHLTFTPRVREALAIASRCRVNACIDISDGLAIDLHRVCEASGVGAVVQAERVPISPAAMALQSPLSHALGDGEDFELLLFVSPDEAERLLAAPDFSEFLTDIGEVQSSPKIMLQQGDSLAELPPRGYEH